MLMMLLMVWSGMLTLTVSEFLKMVPNLSIGGYFNQEHLIISLIIFNKWSLEVKNKHFSKHSSKMKQKSNSIEYCMLFKRILHGVLGKVFGSGRIWLWYCPLPCFRNMFDRTSVKIRARYEIDFGFICWELYAASYSLIKCSMKIVLLLKFASFLAKYGKVASQHCS